MHLNNLHLFLVQLQTWTGTISWALSCRWQMAALQRWGWVDWSRIHRGCKLILLLWRILFYISEGRKSLFWCQLSLLELSVDGSNPPLNFYQHCLVFQIEQKYFGKFAYVEIPFFDYFFLSVFMCSQERLTSPGKFTKGGEGGWTTVGSFSMSKKRKWPICVTASVYLTFSYFAITCW